MKKQKSIIITEPQKLRKDLHKLIDDTYDLGWNSSLNEIEKLIKNTKISDFEDSLIQRVLLNDINKLKKK